MQVAIIAALANQQVIGYQNQLPWHLPADLRHFKQLTLKKPIIMGRKTFESIGKPLPERTNIIISRNPAYQASGCLVAHSLAEALKLANTAEEVMVIGGTTIFEQALPLAQTLYLTYIHADIKGDVFFPPWNADDWQTIHTQYFNADEKNVYNYSFVTLTRKI